MRITTSTMRYVNRRFFDRPQRSLVRTSSPLYRGTDSTKRIRVSSKRDGIVTFSMVARWSRGLNLRIRRKHIKHEDKPKKKIKKISKINLNI